MVLSKRETNIAIAAAAAVAGLLFWLLALTPYLDWRQAVEEQARTVQQRTDLVNHLYARRLQLLPVWAEMKKGGLDLDASEAESQVWRSVVNWVQSAGASITAFRPERASQEGNFQMLDFRVMATGSSRSVAKMLWSLETAEIPLRIDDMQITPRREGADDLSIQISLSTLCQSPGSPKPAATQPAGPGGRAMSRALTMLLWIACCSALAADLSGPASPTTAPAIPLPAAATRPATARPTEPTRRSSRRSDRREPRSNSSRGESATPLPTSMPSDFSVLSSRSIFVRGILNSDGGGRGSSPEPVRLPDSRLQFDGVALEDGRFIAFVENTSDGRVSLLRPGDPVGQGKVAGISLDTLDYDYQGKIVHVAVGQPLSGYDAGRPSTQPTTSPSMSSGSSSPADVNDVLERLRQRRQQELGGK